MTREEAIDRLRKISEKTPIRTNGDDLVAITMAIQALSQEPCDDAISRVELLKAIDTWDKFGCDADTKLVPYKDHYIPYIHYDDVVKAIKGMLSVTQKSGKWIETDDKYGAFFICDKCHRQSDIMEHFCPNCGAEMEISDADSD